MNNTVVQNIDVSYTAPDLPTPLISRPHLTDTLVQIFDSGAEIVCVEGRSGYGKTTLLREFAQFSTSPCFSVFIKSGSRHAYDPSLVRADFAEQISWYLESKRLDINRDPTDGELRHLITRCARALGRRNERAYFVLDGLNHIPNEDDSLLQAIMALLPFGLNSFRFLLSSDINKKDIFAAHRHLEVKPFTLMAFTSHETDEFLSDVIPEKSLRSQYHSSLGGVPLLLASVRRQILVNPNSGYNQALNLPNTIDAFLEAEWNLLNPMSEEMESGLSYLLAYGGPVSVEQLLTHISSSEVRLVNEFNRLPFLSFSKNRGTWDFTSDPFRRFAATQLRAKVQAATEKIATKLLEDPDSESSLSYLPQFLQRTSVSNRILEWFNEKRFAAILFKTRMPAWTEPILRNAITISHDSKNDQALSTYSILRSLVPQISNTTGIEHEIRARCTLGDFSGAQAVCDSVPLFTQRLRLLSVLVDASASTPGISTQPLLEEIKELLTKVDFSSLQKEEVIDIATDLYPVDPQTALKILKSAIQDFDDDSMEIAMARITISAVKSQQILTRTESIEHNEESAPKAVEVLVNERIRKFIEATRISFRTRSAQEILSKTENIVEPSERLFILRKWILEHSDEPDIILVVESAIQDSISSTQFSPTATFYREVLTPLPQSNDINVRSKLVSIVDAQKPIIQSKGPTVEYVRLELLLAQCNYIDNKYEVSAHRIEDLYLEILDGLDTLETRATCFSWCLAEIEHFDSACILDQITDIRGILKDELSNSITSILENSANQFSILEGALEPLALYMPNFAFDIAKKLNTANRRNDAYLYIIETICDSAFVPGNTTFLYDALDAMDRGEIYDIALTKIIARLAELIEDNLASENEISWGHLRVINGASASIRAECLGMIAAALGEETDQSNLLATISDQLLTDFRDINIPRLRYSIGCKLVVKLHGDCPKLASDVFKLFSQNNLVSRIGENIDKGCFYILHLLIKSTSALATSALLQRKDVIRVRDMISRVDDPVLRIRLSSSLAFYFWREQLLGYFDEVVNEDIWPNIGELNSCDLSSIYLAWEFAYPVVWLENRDRARAAIEQFPRQQVNDCIWALCFALLHKQPIGEPLDGRSKRSTTVLSFSDVHKLLQLCEELKEDYLVYYVCEEIADQITKKDNSTRLTKNQKAEIGRILSEMADRIFPFPSGIQHEGYKIVCKAQAFRISSESTESWNKLIDDAMKLENASDRTYVLAILGSILPTKLKRRRDELFSEAENSMDQIRSIGDRMDGYCVLVQLGMDINKKMATRLMEKAFRMIAASGDSESETWEKDLIDLAYRIDPELPMKLALIYDDDPAREKFKKRARRQLDRQELKREIGSHDGDIDLRNRRNDPNLAVAAWQALGTYNAGRMVAVDMSRIRDMLACASNYPLKTAYPMYSWVLSNLEGKYASTPQAARYIRGIFEGLLKGNDFFFATTLAGGKLEFNPEWREQNRHDQHAIIGIGERERGVDFLRSWLQQNLEKNLIIVDPYFCPEDLWIIKLILEINPHVEVQIITRRTLREESGDEIGAERFNTIWRSLCDQSPPRTEIIRVGFVQSSKEPFHDRWIISKNAGIRLGTSINSIGNKISEFSAMGDEDLERIRYAIDGFLTRKTRELGGEQLVYELFELAA